MNGLFNQQQFPPVGMPQGLPDMSTMDPHGQDPVAPMPSAEMSQGASVQNQFPQNQTPVYVGDPIVDKYIHMFIGGHAT